MELYFHPANPGMSPAETHLTYRWRQEGHPAKTRQVKHYQKGGKCTYGQVQAFTKMTVLDYGIHGIPKK